MLFSKAVCFMILVIIEQGSTCMPTMAPDGVIPITDTPEEMTTMPLTALSTSSTTTAPACTAPRNTAPMLSDAEFRQYFNRTAPQYNITTHEEARCNHCSEGTTGFYSSAASAYPDGDGTESILIVPPAGCQDICICNELAECYKKGPGRFGLYLYSYCDDISCGVYFVIPSTGSLVPVNGVGKVYEPDPEYSHPVTDGDVYLKGTTVSCTTCIKTNCV